MDSEAKRRLRTITDHGLAVSAHDAADILGLSLSRACRTLRALARAAVIVERPSGLDPSDARRHGRTWTSPR